MNSQAVGCTIPRVLSLLLFLVSGWLIVGGAWLASLGGSLFYLLSGLITLVVALLLRIGRTQGQSQARLLSLWLYLGLTAATLVWALSEIGLDFWLLLPRLGMPRAYLIN